MAQYPGRGAFDRTARRDFFYALFALIFPTSLRGANFPEYPFRPATSYRGAVSFHGFTIAAEPVSDPRSQREYFHLDFTKKNYLPVFLVLDNQSATDSFIVKPEDIGVYLGDQQTHAGDVPAGRSKAGERVMLGSAIALSIAGMAIANYMMVRALDVRQNVIKKQLRAVTLSPGQSTHGFIYLPLKNGGQEVGKLGIRVRVNRIGQDQPTDLDLSLQMG